MIDEIMIFPFVVCEKGDMSCREDNNNK